MTSSGGLTLVICVRLYSVLHSGQEHAHRRLGDGVHRWRPAHAPGHGPQPGHRLLLPHPGQERQRSGAAVGPCAVQDL